MSEAMGEDMVELPKLETEKDEEDEQVLDSWGLILSLNMYLLYRSLLMTSVLTVLELFGTMRTPRPSTRTSPT